MIDETDIRSLIEFVEEYANEEELTSPYGVRATLDKIEEMVKENKKIKRFISVIMNKFIIQAYHTRHNDTGYEVSICEKKSFIKLEECIFAEITEEECNLINEVK